MPCLPPSRLGTVNINHLCLMVMNGGWYSYGVLFSPQKVPGDSLCLDSPPLIVGFPEEIQVNIPWKMNIKLSV